MSGLTNWLGQDRIRHIAYYNDLEQIIDCFLLPDDPPSWHHQYAAEPPPLETGGDWVLTNWLSFPDLLQHIGFVGDEGVEDLFTESNSTPRPWRIYNVTNDTGGPSALRDALTSWWSDSDHTQHIVYIGDGGHVEEVWVVPGVPPWKIRDVTDDIGAHGGQWAQSGALTTWLSLSGDGLRHIAYIDRRGHVQDCYMKPGKYPWQNYDPTEDTGGPQAQPGALTSWWSDPVPDVIAGQQHVVYIDGRGHVQEAFVQPDGVRRWQIRDVTDDIGASSGQWAQAGALTTWWSTVDGLRHIAYIDQRGHIQDCYMQPGKYPWRNYDVTEDTEGPTARPGALTSWWFVGDNTQHVAYVDDATHVQEAFVHPNVPPWKIRTVL